MAISTYSELQSAVASWLHRTDLTSQIQDFIRLAESDLQVRARLSQWDTTGTVSLTSGVGSLPSDFASAISLGYGTNYTLDQLPLVRFNDHAVGGESGEPVYWTIRGSSLLVYPLYTGDVTLDYRARFTPLSDSATTNSLLTLFPDAYLHGSLMHACDWDSNDAGLQKYGALFEAAIGRIRKYIKATIKATFPNIDGAVTATQTEINTIVGLTATAAELNILDGATLSTTELNYLDGVTSAIQTQLDAKAPGNPTISVKIDNFNAASGFHYILRTNSSKTVTFPGTPTAGQYFWVTNHSGGNWTGARNSENIMGAASNDTLATGKHYEYRYIDSTTGWARTRSN